MYKRPAEAFAVPTESKRSWLFLAVCCLGLVGVLSASTFVLSIINTYLSGKPVTVTNIVDNDVFYLRYLSFVNESTSLTGSFNELQSLSEIEQRINQGMSSPDEGIKITYGTSQTTFLRRRRHLTYDPYRRDITTEVVFHCEYKYKENCLSQDCRSSARQRINNNIKKTGTLLNVLLVTANEQFGTQVSSTTLVFSEILQQTQATFKTIREAEDETVGSNIKKRATSTTTTVSFCTAVKSGSFSDAKIWKSGTVPSGKCSIVIPSGFTVTFTGELFSVQVPKLIVQGSFVVSSTTSITFKYAISIVVEASGSFKDQSSQHKLYFLPGSSFIFYSGASFVGSGTVAYTYLTIPASGSAGSNVKFGSKFTGPFTFISTNAGNVNNSGSSTYIVAKSGAFTAKSTWLGACVPTSSLCTSLKPCTLYIPSGCALTTADLKGKFDINFNEIVVDSGATFSLGTAGLSAGFQFKYSFTFTIRGILGFAASGGNIQLPWGCAFNFFSGASFSSKLTCQIQSYNPSSTSVTATLLTLSSTYKSSFFVSVSLTGVKTISTTYVTAVPPGGTTAVVRTTTKAPTTKAVTTTKAPTTTVWTVIKSGSFTDAKIWKSGTVPSGKCTVIIPSGFTVTFTGDIFTYQVTTLTIGGTFVFSSTTSITFKYAISIVVEATGSFKDQSSQHKIYFLGGSFCSFYSGASFVGSGTIAYYYKTLPASGSFGAKYTLGSKFSGPFTFLISLSGEIKNFASLTFIASGSGGFLSKSTWFGGLVPSASLCSLLGCRLYIPKGCAVTTAELKGTLDINFNEISVDSGATFSLGTAGLSGGFRFKYRFTFNIRGILGFASPSGSIELPWGCAFNFFSGASFSSSRTCQVRTYNPSSWTVGSMLLSLSASYKSAFFCGVSLLGVKTISKTEVTAIPSVTTTTAKPSTGSVWTVIKSGSFADAKIWKSGTVPSGKCTVIIPSGFTVTFTGEIFTYQVTTLTIGGSFVVSSTGGCAFKYAINIVVQATGSFKDQTSLHRLYFLAGSYFNFYSGGSFLGSGSVAYYYKTLPASGSLGASYKLGSKFSGPFTFIVLLSGSIRSFGTASFIATASGGFLSKSTWAGGVIPSTSLCTLLHACSLYIPSGYVITTAELNGLLDMNFKEIVVESGATLTLGTAGVSGGFRFKYALTLSILGVLGFASPSGSIELPWLSAFNFFSGARYSSSRTAQVRTYNPLTWSVGSMLIELSSSYTGSYYVSVSLLGFKKVSSTPIGF